MAKTNFENGTIVSSTFLDAIFEHTHDGEDNDGHCPKVDLSLAAEVTGTLPLANLEGIGSDDVSDESDLNTASVSAALNSVKSFMDDNEVVSGSFVGFLDGADFSGGIDINFLISYIIFRDFVTIHFPEVTGTSASGNLNLKATNIPSAIRPDSLDHQLLIVINDSVKSLGAIKPCPGTYPWNFVLQSSTNELNAAFTAYGTKGICRQSIIYHL